MKTVSPDFPQFRFRLLCMIIFVSLAFLLGRLAWLQIISPEELVRQGDRRSLREEPDNVPRGMIVDRAGRPLAISVPAAAIWADPKTLIEEGGVVASTKWQMLASELHIPLGDIFNRIHSNAHSRFIYLARQLEPQQAQYINGLNIPGISLHSESRRFYPAGHVGANLIGFTNIDDQGIEGIEKSYNRLLTGRQGNRVVRKDRFGRVVEKLTALPSVPAENLVLSIDQRLQSISEDALNYAVSLNKAESGAAVIVDIQTGEILAMISSPTYNPNNRKNTKPDDFRNRAISDAFEPGSTIKPLVIMAALKQAIVKPDSVIDTRPYTLSKHLIHDVGYYPRLTVTGILQKSSDTGVSRLSLAMPLQVLWDIYQKFGFGEHTSLGLTGESNGLLPVRKHWSALDRATFSFGYGLMVTPLQLAHIYATIGSNGISRPLSILRVDRPVEGRRIFPEAIVHQVVHMMESVALPGGGGIKAAVPGYRVAVKTGTAKKINNRGQYINKYVAYTAGVAPVSSPRYALVVVINNPSNGKYYGGAVSAPVFSQIMGQVLRLKNIRPDAPLRRERKSTLARNQN
jgi:cell division protein FtsI (penicillin-binding protein 3)